MLRDGWITGAFDLQEELRPRTPSPALRSESNQHVISPHHANDYTLRTWANSNEQPVPYRKFLRAGCQRAPYRKLFAHFHILFVRRVSNQGGLHESRSYSPIRTKSPHQHPSHFPISHYRLAPDAATQGGYQFEKDCHIRIHL